MSSAIQDTFAYPSGIFEDLTEKQFDMLFATADYAEQIAQARTRGDLKNLVKTLKFKLLLEGVG